MYHRICLSENVCSYTSVFWCPRTSSTSTHFCRDNRDGRIYSPADHRIGLEDRYVLTHTLVRVIDAHIMKGTKKAHMRLDKLWWNSFMTGPLLSFGCAITVSTNAAPWYQENAPGLIRTVAAIFFPIGALSAIYAVTRSLTNCRTRHDRIERSRSLHQQYHVYVDSILTSPSFRH